MADLKNMLKEVKQAIKEQASTTPVDAVTLYPEVAPDVSNIDYTNFPPQVYQVTNQQYQQPFGPRPRTQRPRAPFPTSQYRNTVRPGYTSQPMYEPRFDQGYVPRRMYQPRPYQGSRPRFDPTTQANAPTPLAIQGLPPPGGAPRYGDAMPPRQTYEQQTPYQPFCTRCNCAHAYGYHVAAPAKFCTFHQSTTHSDAECYNQQAVQQLAQQQNQQNPNIPAQGQTAPLN